jgi:hypothetical protein
MRNEGKMSRRLGNTGNEKRENLLLFPQNCRGTAGNYLSLHISPFTLVDVIFLNTILTNWKHFHVTLLCHKTVTRHTSMFE